MAQSTLVSSKNVKFAITESEVPKNNHLGRLDFDGIKYPHLVEVAKFLKQSCIAYALTVDPKPSKTLLQLFWFTAEETTITNKKGHQVPAISFCTDLGKGMITAFSLRKALRFPDKPKSGFEALPTDAELIRFLDDMESCWDNKPRSTIPNKKLTLIKKANMPSQLNFFFSHFIQCMSGKSGSLDQANKVQLQMAYSVIAGKNFDFATAIFDDLKSKIEKTERDPKIPYVQFICAYLKFLYANNYPTTHDGSFAKMGQRSLEVKPLDNEVSIYILRSRLSLHSSTSAATQEVHSSASPTATTGSKRPSVSSFGPSKKTKVTKETSASSSRPEEVSRKTSLDDFVVLSSTYAAMITSTVPSISVAVTTTVTQPEIAVLQSTEVPSKLPYSSIPISNPSISLVSDPSLLQQPHVAFIVPDPQMLERDMQFFNMFDRSGTPKPNTHSFSPSKPVTQTLTFLSGPSLATVDANVNSLGEKVVSLTAAVNDTTSAVNTAGTELKTLTVVCLTKAEASHISALQEDLVKVKEDTQRKFDALSSKVDSCTTLLQQVLDKLNAPAPTPSLSFTSDDSNSLNVVVEFIHQATSDLPLIEGRLDSLEAEVQKLASAQPSSPIKDLSLADNDKEGEKEAEEIKEGETTAEAAAVEVQHSDPPSHVEGEKVDNQTPPSFKDFVEEEKEEDEDEEDLDLEDQEEEEPHQEDDDDDDDDEDQSLWCSSAAITSTVITSKEVVTTGGES
ncbi:hypothetical protein L6452_08703 [Arctium lappa]|uniref:Uncharacterized protein n=1 Tax=Arctium lappa TaxID=4217 RepID=A0ACB9DJ15_ARCLA|nr:hypothetical protein L6452_08703 [Arctium lappa]